MSEAVQNRLYIPTMLMFIGILVVIIVPAMGRVLTCNSEKGIDGNIQIKREVNENENVRQDLH